MSATVSNPVLAQRGRMKFARTVVRVAVVLLLATTSGLLAIASFSQFSETDSFSFSSAASDAKALQIVSQTSHQSTNLGILRPKQEVTTTFSIQNSTANRLVVTGLRTTCSCALAKPAFQFLEPSESKVLEIAYKAPPKNTDFRQSVRVFFDGGPPAVLELTGMVRSEIVAIPESVSFHRLVRGQPSECRMEIGNFTNSILEPIVASSEAWLSTTSIVPLPTRSIPKGAIQGWRVTLRADADKLAPGEHCATVTVTSPTQTAAHVCAVPVSVSVMDAVYLVPREIFLGRVAPGETREFRALLWFTSNARPTSANDIEFDSTMGDAMSFKCIPTSLPERWTLMATLAPQSAESFIEGTVTARFSNRELPELVIPIRGRVSQ